MKKYWKKMDQSLFIDILALAAEMFKIKKWHVFFSCF